MKFTLENPTSAHTWKVFAIVLIGTLVCMQSFRFGKNKGEAEVLDLFQKSELQIIPLSNSGIQLVLIRQIMPQRDYRSRVQVDTSGFEGVEAKQLSQSGWGRREYSELVSLWQILNKTDRVIEIKEGAFSNLPSNFSLKSDYYDEQVIRIKASGGNGNSDAEEAF